MSAQPYLPGPMPDTPPKKKPSVIGIVLGILLAVVIGPIAGITLIVTSTVSSIGGVTSAPVFQADGTEQQVAVSANTVMGVWIDSRSSGQCEVLDADGNDIALGTPTGGSQTVNNLELVAIFTPLASGNVTVSCWGNSVFPYKVATLISVGGLAGGIVAGVLILIVAFFGGVIWMIVTLVRRSNWNSKYGPKAVGAFPPNPAPYPIQPGYASAPPAYPEAQPYAQPPAYPQPPYGQQPPAGGPSDWR